MLGQYACSALRCCRGDVGATVGAKLDVAYPRDPLWRLYGLAAGDVAFTIDLLGEEERFEQEIFRIEKEIASGEAKPPVITILNPNPTIDLLFEKWTYVHSVK